MPPQNPSPNWSGGGAGAGPGVRNQEPGARDTGGELLEWWRKRESGMLVIPRGRQREGSYDYSSTECAPHVTGPGAGPSLPNNPENTAK